MDVIVCNGKGSRRRDGDLKVGIVSTVRETGLAERNIYVSSIVNPIIQHDISRNGYAGRQVRVSYSTEADGSGRARCAVAIGVCEVDVQGIAKIPATWNTDDVKPGFGIWLRTGWNYAISAGLGGDSYNVLGRDSEGAVQAGERNGNRHRKDGDAGWDAQRPI
jgi:hypothetical protein